MAVCGSLMRCLGCGRRLLVLDYRKSWSLTRKIADLIGLAWEWSYEGGGYCLDCAKTYVTLRDASTLRLREMFIPGNFRQPWEYTTAERKERFSKSGHNWERREAWPFTER